jgi:2-polyprenyl-6-methoxyphenol hydroxylase-like FAD-dependent oxidoreductase
VARAERGWTVRVHERTPVLRAEGFAIAMQPNMLKVVESLGVRDEVLRGGLRIVRRETRNRQNIYGRLTTWPERMRSLAFHALGRVKWLRRRYQRTANHVPTGYRPAGLGTGS